MKFQEKVKKIKHLSLTYVTVIFVFLIRWVIVALFLYFAIFTIMNYIPIDPARVIAGPNAPIETVQELRSTLGLDKPFAVKFKQQLKLVLKGELGYSFYYKTPVQMLVSKYFGWSLAISLMALAAGSTIGHVMGIFLHLRKSHNILFFLKILSAIPGYLLCLLVLWTGAEILGVTPGSNPFLYTILTFFIGAFHPAITIGWFVYEKLDEVERFFSFPWFYKGLGFSHLETKWISLRFVLIPTFVVSIGKFGYVVTTIFFCELIFNLAGFGAILLQSVYRGDTQVVAGGALIIALVVWSVEEIGNILKQKSVFYSKTILT